VSSIPTLSQILAQPLTTSDKQLFPTKTRLITRRLLRCVTCDTILYKGEYSPNVVKPRLQVIIIYLIFKDVLLINIYFSHLLWDFVPKFSRVYSERLDSYTPMERKQDKQTKSSQVRKRAALCQAESTINNALLITFSVEILIGTIFVE
jgi:hypothetical protein